MISNFKKIFKLNKGSADRLEKNQLENWNEEQYENLKALYQSDDLDEKIASLKGYEFYDQKKAFEKITGEKYNPESKVIANSFYKYAAAAAVVLVLAFTFLFYNSNTEIKSTEYVASNEIKSLILPDDSKVTLDKNSSINYASNRTVSLKGRAYFNVTKDAEQPFVIQTHKGKVTVLGTRFTVWADQDNLEVSVEEGRVKYDYDGRSIILEHDQWMKLVGNDIVSSSISSTNQFSWQQQSLHFKNAPIDVVLNDLTRHFGITVKLDNSIRKKPKCLLTSSFKNESIEQVLSELKTLFDISIVKKSNEYVITAINC